MGNEDTTGRTRERGSVMVIAALAMTALLLFAALAIDVGLLWSSRTQSQNAVDAAALAAASKMIVQSGTDPATVDLVEAQKEGNLYGGKNSTVGNPTVKVRKGDATGAGGDFTFGSWDLATRTFTPLSGADLANPNLVTAVRANVLMDDAVDTNKQSPTFLSTLIGKYGFTVQNTATAYLGFEGSFQQGEFDLPVAIDSCQISSGGCGSDFCQVASVDNPCQLHWIQGANPVTCLEFASTPEQNACWTVYDDSSPSVNNPDLQGIVDSGNPNDMHAGDFAYLDNGSKTATLKYIRNKFYGCNNAGKNCGNGIDGTPDQRGFDRYGTNPLGFPASAPAIDSWVVKLPVFECQAGVHCAGGSTGRINGGVCFEIREIIAPAGDYADPADPDKEVIKGRFLCPDSTDEQERALFDQYCREDSDSPQDASPGGCNFGLRAQHLVLVK
jgi:hypothetical protein